MIFRRPDPRPLVRYLSRTVYGGPIRDARILEVTADHVTFRYHNWRDREEGFGTPPSERELRLQLGDFVSRCSEHNADPGQKTVRYSALLAAPNKTLGDLAREHLGQRPSPEDAPLEAGAEQPVVRCPKCSAPMTVRELPPKLFVLSPAACDILRSRASPFFRKVA